MSQKNELLRSLWVGWSSGDQDRRLCGRQLPWPWPHGGQGSISDYSKPCRMRASMEVEGVEIVYSVRFLDILNYDLIYLKTLF